MDRDGKSPIQDIPIHQGVLADRLSKSSRNYASDPLNTGKCCRLLKPEGKIIIMQGYWLPLAATVSIPWTNLRPSAAGKKHAAIDSGLGAVPGYVLTEHTLGISRWYTKLRVCNFCNCA